MTEHTLADITLAKIYFELLVAFAKEQPGETLTYSQLVEMAKQAHPNNEYVEGALAVSTGRRLGALREFTTKYEVPDLSALVVSKATGDNGVGFSRSYDGDDVRQKIAQFKWSSLQIKFDEFIIEEMMTLENKKMARQKPKKIKEAEARQMLWEYYRDNKAEVGSLSLNQREEAIKMIMEGFSLADSVAKVKSELLKVI
jgi:hypothetical protein